MNTKLRLHDDLPTSVHLQTDAGTWVIKVEITDTYFHAHLYFTDIEHAGTSLLHDGFKLVETREDGDMTTRQELEWINKHAETILI